MWRYLGKRILQFIPVIFAVAILIFSLLYITPGDPAQQMLGGVGTAEQVAELKHQLGIDRPFLVQLGDFLKNAFLKFDFGSSYMNKVDVKSEILKKLPYTAKIAAIVCIVQMIIAIPLGVAAATHKGKFIDRFCIFIAMVGNSLPGFLFALMMVLIFSVNLKWLPAYGIKHWYSYVLPCAASAIMGIAGLARQTRSQMLDVISSDYCVTAKAKGVPAKRILYTHALPNALIPIITGIGGSFGRALGGTVVIENVFAIPGLGLYLVNGINQRDYPVVRGTVVVLALLFSIVMLAVDLCYAYIDPRIKAQYEGQQKKRGKKNG